MTAVPAIVTPLSAAVLLPLIYIFRKRQLAKAIAVLGILSLAVSLWTALSGWGSPFVERTGGWPPALGIVLVVDPLAALFLLLAATGFALTLVNSLEKLGGGPWRYYALLFLSWAAVNGIFSTGDLFNLYVFYEIFSVSAYLMVAFSTMAWQAIEAGFKYLVFGTVGALFFLIGTAYTFMATGLLNLALLPEALTKAPHATVTVLSACLLIALLIKTGTFPTHFWLPDAHSSAQSAVSALLSGVLVKVSLYVLIRLSSLLFIEVEREIFPIILAVGSLSLLAGHMMASRQDDLKRLLAYSTVAQIGYVLIGVGCASGAGFSAAVYHIFNHMAAKMGLFITAGLLVDDGRTRMVSEMSGLGRHRPFLAGTFGFFAAALVGIPPLNGFMSKWFLTLASLERGQILPALCLIAGTLISAGYYLKVLRALFAHGETPPARHSKPAAHGGLIFLMLLCLVLAILPFLPDLWDNLNRPLIDAVMNRAAYIGRVIRP